MLSRHIAVFAALFILVLSQISVAEAAYKCPERIASNENSLVSIYSKKFLEKVYQKLGCTTEFIALPFKRGIRDFNVGKVDGEVLRVRWVEKLYNVPFVRSEGPMFRLTNYLWGHPDQSVRLQRTIGYVHGIVWHETYMEGKKGENFYNETDMFEAYNQGVISGFLSNNFTAKSKIRENNITPTPLHLEIVKSQ